MALHDSRFRPASRRTEPIPRPDDHDLVAVDEWLPGAEPNDYDFDRTDEHEHRTRYWRCRRCGQERTRREAFRAPCPVEEVPDPVAAGGYSVEDARTRRALTEAMTVRYGERGPGYLVVGESGATYEVDIAAETCSCPDHAHRQVVCKHLRRVDLEIRAGQLPGPDGTFAR